MNGRWTPEGNFLGEMWHFEKLKYRWCDIVIWIVYARIIRSSIVWYCDVGVRSNNSRSAVWWYSAIDTATGGGLVPHSAGALRAWKVGSWPSRARKKSDQAAPKQTQHENTTVDNNKNDERKTKKNTLRVRLTYQVSTRVRKENENENGNENGEKKKPEKTGEQSVYSGVRSGKTLRTRPDFPNERWS